MKVCVPWNTMDQIRSDSYSQNLSHFRVKSAHFSSWWPNWDMFIRLHAGISLYCQSTLSSIHRRYSSLSGKCETDGGDLCSCIIIQVSQIRCWSPRCSWPSTAKSEKCFSICISLLYHEHRIFQVWIIFISHYIIHKCQHSTMHTFVDLCEWVNFSVHFCHYSVS